MDRGERLAFVGVRFVFPLRWCAFRVWCAFSVGVRLVCQELNDLPPIKWFMKHG
jgi:hypothetical protein